MNPSDRLSPPADDLAASALADLRREFRAQQALAERALAQVEPAAFLSVPADGGNSLAVLVKHVAGNLRSRWTDLLTTDGEKPDRQRDSEFVMGDDDTHDSLQAAWRVGWSTLHDTLAALAPDDLLRTVTIRGEPHTVLQAALRQHAHYAYHIGQIVQLARRMARDEWHWLSIPPGSSQAFNGAPAPFLGEVDDETGSPGAEAG